MNAAPAAHIDVLFDGPPGPTPGRFIDCVDDTGQGVRAGEWIERGEGEWALRIPTAAPVDEHDRLHALANAVETYLSGGRSTAGLRGLYDAREALHGAGGSTDRGDTPSRGPKMADTP